MKSLNLKAAERTCRNCGTVIPPQPSGPGRPKIFCARHCRRDFYYKQEQALVERERADEADRRLFAYESRVYGVREAKRRAKDRARNRPVVV